MATGGYGSSLVPGAPKARTRVVIIVDPYSSGRYLVHELASLRWPMVGIQSSLELAPFWLKQFDASLFVKSIQHESLEATIDALKEFEVVSVLPGSEPGVLLAEDLADRFGVQSNPSATKGWRRDKHAQQERLREAGVRAVHQIYSSDIDEILTWQQQWGLWPIIVKPTMSGGTDGVYWCHNEDDVRIAHKNECGKMNVNGCMNEKLLAQEYLDGLEYIVDCVSFNGNHIVSGIWVYKKTKDPATRSITYEYAEILESTGPEQNVLREYIFQVLDALNFVNGPSHSEVIITKDGPCLVETGARLHGLKGPKMTEYATGIGTHELVVDIAVNGGRLFTDLHKKQTNYSLKKYAFETMYRNPKVQGILLDPIDTEEIRNLPSVMDVFPSIIPGDELKITRDLATSPGVLLQVHPVKQQCLDDIARLRELEETTLYKVQKDASAPPSPKLGVSPSVMSPLHKEVARQFSEDPGEFVLDGLCGIKDPSADVED